jgi:hypothetical protein
MIRYFGTAADVTIPKTAEILRCGCFSLCETISAVIFEPGSRISCLERQTFAYCSSLSSICIPSSVERICEQCFACCGSRSTVTFESDSKLALLEPDTFPDCGPGLSIWIPPSLQDILRPYGQWWKIIGSAKDSDDSDQIHLFERGI